MGEVEEMWRSAEKCVGVWGRSEEVWKVEKVRVEMWGGVRGSVGGECEECGQVC